MKRRFYLIGIGCLVILAAFIYFVMPFSPVGTPLLVAEATTPEGIEMCVTQTFTGTTEPYEVSFWFHSSSGPWYWYYLDHQALYWRGRIELDTKARQATIFRSGKEVARFNWDTQALSFTTRNGRIVPKPQGILTDSSPLARGVKVLPFE